MTVTASRSLCFSSRFCWVISVIFFLRVSSFIMAFFCFSSFSSYESAPIFFKHIFMISWEYGSMPSNSGSITETLGVTVRLLIWFSFLISFNFIWFYLSSLKPERLMLRSVRLSIALSSGSFFTFLTLLVEVMKDLLSTLALVFLALVVLGTSKIPCFRA